MVQWKCDWEFLITTLQTLCEIQFLFVLWRFFWSTVKTRSKLIVNYFSETSCLLIRDIVLFDCFLRQSVALLEGHWCNWLLLPDRLSLSGFLNPLDWFSQTVCRLIGGWRFQLTLLLYRLFLYQGNDFHSIDILKDLYEKLALRKKIYRAQLPTVFSEVSLVCYYWCQKGYFKFWVPTSIRMFCCLPDSVFLLIVFP